MKKLLVLKEELGTVKGADDIFNKIQSINIDYKQENVIVFYLNTQNKVIDSDVLFKGGLDACLVCPKTIFRKTLRKGASKIIISHNHPSGNLEPSDVDKEIYKLLMEGGNTLGINVLDCIIFNKTHFFSLDDMRSLKNETY